MNKIRKGNYNDVKTRRVHQQARYEASKEQDFHQNVMLDLIATKEFLEEEYKGKHINGYCQELALFPFMVVLYSEESLQLFRKMTRHGRIPLFLDATSNVAKVIDGFDKKKIFYYALVLKSKEGKPVPILEFFSSKQNYLAIQYCLECFFQAYKQSYDLKSFHYKVSRVEIDFSLASLSAACRVFLGQDVDRYFQSIWKALKEDRKMTFCIHICRVHANKFLLEKFETRYKKERVWEKVSSYFQRWVHRYIASKTMDEAAKVFEEILTVVGTKFLTKEIEDIMEHPENFTGKYWMRWKKFNIFDVDVDGAFYLRTPFGAFINKMAADILAQNEEDSDEEKIPNPCYCAKVYIYLCQVIGPYIVLLNKTAFYVTDMPIENDTNNLVEYWHKIFKCDILLKVRYQKISRVVRALSTNVIGAVREALSKVPGKSDDQIESIPEEYVDSDCDGSLDEFDNNKDSNRPPSPDMARDKFKTERSQRQQPESNVLHEMELIPNGGEYKGTKLYNTCSIDNIMQILYYLYTYTSFGREFLDTQIETHRAQHRVAIYLPKMFNLISEKKFSIAKAIWIKGMLGENISGKVKDVWGEELFQGLHPLKGFFPIIERVDCPHPGCGANKKTPRQLDSTYFITSTLNDFLEVLEIGRSRKCKVCKVGNARHYYNAKSGHEYGIFAFGLVGYRRHFEEGKGVTKQGPVFPESKLQPTIRLFGHKFKVVCYTLYNGSHYKSVIVHNGRKLMYDDKKPEMLEAWKQPNDRFSVSTIWVTRI